ncbi:hypothetical protein KALB_1298 [Kutzneria albida DSM 43870]|uniref:DUF1996 domain-containing protein n=1 Tax=Kutzneria albida DSM 43870 TaxID=1449976 RepID=W5W2G3_9PSEU|nr:hypothetical protein KALB_1298 [Kutzneria albida DSM 43870]
MFGKLRMPRSRGVRITAILTGALLTVGSAVGVGVASGLGSAEAAAAPDSPQLASVKALLADQDTQFARGGNRGRGNNRIGPFQRDFVDIQQVRPNQAQPNGQGEASTGTFLDECGKNENGHHNSDNFIVTPGEDHGALHVHDYVGNTTTTARSTNRSLSKGDTTCANGDQSTFFWPVIRIQREANGQDNRQDQGPDEGNVGRLIEPNEVKVLFKGNATSQVREAPTFLRSITGDAKAGTNGPDNARPSWTCTGFEDRLTSKYPVCPNGSQVKRILDFPSCWNGRSTDSADHRSHLVFPKANGSCPRGFRAVPQLEYQLTYPVPTGSVFAVDGFSEQQHNPITDHADWENLMSRALMQQVVNCINSGKNC